MAKVKVQPLPFMLSFCSDAFSILLGMEFFLLHNELARKGSAEVHGLCEALRPLSPWPLPA